MSVVHDSTAPVAQLLGAIDSSTLSQLPKTTQTLIEKGPATGNTGRPV